MPRTDSQAPPRDPPRGAGPPGGIVNRRRDSVSPMRTHTYSISILHTDDGHWNTTIVQSTYKRGVLVDARIVFGPLWLTDEKLDTRVSAAVQQLKKLVHDDEVRQEQR